MFSNLYTLKMRGVLKKKKDCESERRTRANTKAHYKGHSLLLNLNNFVSLMFKLNNEL